MTVSISRIERFARIGSTQEVVRGWLADGVPEVCIAVAEEQTAGRGRLDRSWQAPPGTAILVSAGFRPDGLRPEHGWRLGAIAALSMLEAVEATHGETAAGLGLKWPNDLVVRRDGRIHKLGGVLGEAVADQGRLEAVIVGLGVNADWAADAFPPDLAATMSSIRDLTGDPVDRERLLDAWLERLGAAYDSLREGAFPSDRWADRQATTGADVEIDLGDVRQAGGAIGVDPESGALLVRGADGQVRAYLYGDVVRCRLRGMEAIL